MLNLISGSLVLCFGRGLSFLLQLTIATNLSPAVMHSRVAKPSLHQLLWHYQLQALPLVWDVRGPCGII